MKKYIFIVVLLINSINLIAQHFDDDKYWKTQGGIDWEITGDRLQTEKVIIEDGKVYTITRERLYYAGDTGFAYDLNGTPRYILNFDSTKAFLPSGILCKVSPKVFIRKDSLVSIGQGYSSVGVKKYHINDLTTFDQFRIGCRTTGKYKYKNYKNKEPITGGVRFTPVDSILNLINLANDPGFVANINDPKHDWKLERVYCNAAVSKNNEVKMFSFFDDTLSVYDLVSFETKEWKLVDQFTDPEDLIEGDFETFYRKDKLYIFLRKAGHFFVYKPGLLKRYLGDGHSLETHPHREYRSFDEPPTLIFDQDNDEVYLLREQLLNYDKDNWRERAVPIVYVEDIDVPEPEFDGPQGALFYRKQYKEIFSVLNKDQNQKK